MPAPEKRKSMRHTIKALHALWDSGDVARIPEIYSENFVAHMPKGWERSEFVGHSGVAEALQRIRNAFPDWHEEIADLILSKNRAVTRYVSTGTHRGRFIGLEATGRKITIDEISIYRFEEGLVAEQWCLTDDLSLAKQLGYF